MPGTAPDGGSPVQVLLRGILPLLSGLRGWQRGR